MSGEFPTPEQSPQDVRSPQGHQNTKPQRVLACQLCQQRKVKCDRRFPCFNCSKAGVQCLSAALIPRQRRRRFPERELLDRVRYYEDLLRRHNIQFQPLHPPNTEDLILASSSKNKENLQEHLSPSARNIPIHCDDEDPTAAKNFWHAMNRKPQDVRPDDHYREQTHHPESDDSDDSAYLLREKDVKDIWDDLFDGNEEILFWSRDTSIDLPSLHPNQIQIFQLWQTYLENVDPLLKVTHTPSLQSRIIQAASDVTRIDPNLEALMFSIYCMAVFAMMHVDCVKQFGESRHDLLQRYQLGARQALLKSGFLKTKDRECLTALHFYLITVKPLPSCDPRSLSTILGAAVRIAQRMCIHDEACNSKFPVLEAELRRRLWWSLVLYDARISEMTEFKVGPLLPTWHCKTPLNVNDFDLRSESTIPPMVHSAATSEALFSVLRSELGDFLRYADFHLDFINPALKAITRRRLSEPGPITDELDLLERRLEDQYLRHCDASNPLQFMTIWWTRGQIAKFRFIRNLSEASESTVQRTDAHRDLGVSYALRMLECDTKVSGSKLVQGFRWLTYLNFPFPAYVHVIDSLRKRPLGEHTVIAWETMSANCLTRFIDHDSKENPLTKRALPFFKIFASVILDAWAVRQAALAKSGATEAPPPMIADIRSRLALAESDIRAEKATENSGGVVETEGVDLAMTVPLNSDASFLGAEDLIGAGLDQFSVMHMQPPANMNVNHWGWPSMNWNATGGNGYGW